MRPALQPFACGGRLVGERVVLRTVGEAVEHPDGLGRRGILQDSRGARRRGTRRSRSRRRARHSRLASAPPVPPAGRPAPGGPPSRSQNTNAVRSAPCNYRTRGRPSAAPPTRPRAPAGRLQGRRPAARASAAGRDEAAFGDCCATGRWRGPCAVNCCPTKPTPSTPSRPPVLTFVRTEPTCTRSRVFSVGCIAGRLEQGKAWKMWSNRWFSAVIRVNCVMSGIRKPTEGLHL